jgi:Rap1a immunity proteins
MQRRMGVLSDADIAGAVHQVNAMTRTIAIVAIVLTSTLAPAHALTSREWQDACESPDLRQQALCATYAAGVFDAMMFLQVTEPRTATTCYPTSPQPTAAQIVDVGIRHIRKAIAEFPDQRDFFRQTPVVSLLLSAFKAAWPCPSPGR